MSWFDYHSIWFKAQNDLIPFWYHIWLLIFNQIDKSNMVFKTMVRHFVKDVFYIIWLWFPDCGQVWEWRWGWPCSASGSRQVVLNQLGDFVGGFTRKSLPMVARLGIKRWFPLLIQRRIEKPSYQNWGDLSLCKVLLVYYGVNGPFEFQGKNR